MKQISKRTARAPPFLAFTSSGRVVSPRLASPTTRCREPRCHQGADHLRSRYQREVQRESEKKKKEIRTYISRRRSAILSRFGFRHFTISRFRTRTSH